MSPTVSPPPIRRAWFATLALVVFLVACGGPETERATAGGALQIKLNRLQADVTELGRSSAAVDERLDGYEQELSEATRRLEKAMRGLSKAVAAARSDAAAALERAEAAVRSLAVLTDRYDYHLRRYHGDG